LPESTLSRLAPRRQPQRPAKPLRQSFHDRQAICRPIDPVEPKMDSCFQGVLYGVRRLAAAFFPPSPVCPRGKGPFDLRTWASRSISKLIPDNREMARNKRVRFGQALPPCPGRNAAGILDPRAPACTPIPEGPPKLAQPRCPTAAIPSKMRKRQPTLKRAKKNETDDPASQRSSADRPPPHVFLGLRMAAPKGVFADGSPPDEITRGISDPDNGPWRKKEVATVPGVPEPCSRIAN